MTVREIALTLLTEIEEQDKYANLALNSHLTDSLSQKDKRILTVLLYTAVERRITYDYYIGYLSGRSLADIGTRVKNILRLGLCQILDMISVPDFAAVNETVKLAKNQGERSFINGVLRRASRERDLLPLPDRKKNLARYLSVRYSYPQKTVKRFIASLGEEDAERLLSAFENSNYTDLTVNTLKITPKELAQKLCGQGYSACALEISPITVRIDGSCDPRELYGFDEGLFFVQDAACAISALALGARAGERIVDACACPGGKSFASAIISQDGAEIFSFDLHESKLSLIESGRDRLGLQSIRTSARDAREPDERLLGTADKVICDVPCSGLGVLSKKPDLRYRDIDGIEELAALGLDILEASARYLKVGGVLAFSTCTLEKAENSGTVSSFLSAHPEFSPVDFEIGEIKSECGELTLYPHIHSTDGFYIALLKRNK